MSAPRTNVDKQKRQHRGPLIGMAVVVIAALGGLVWWLGEEAQLADPPDSSAPQIDGRTGDEVPAN